MITGTNFSPPVGKRALFVGEALAQVRRAQSSFVTDVEFNNLSAEFDVDGNTITATVPAGATDGPIKVTTEDGTDTSTDNFDVIEPALTITHFDPPMGPVGTSVEITGTNFTEPAAVSFNQVPATNEEVNSSTQITATVPIGATTGPISVTTPDGTVKSANFTVLTGPLPTVTAPSGPDLVITSIATRAAGELARALLVTVLVANQAEGDTGRFLVAVESASGFLGTANFPSLGADETARRTVRIKIPIGFPGRTEQFTISVDSEELVDESDEENNVELRNLFIPSSLAQSVDESREGSWVPWVGAAGGLVILVTVAVLARRSSRLRKRRPPNADRVRATLHMETPEVFVDVVDREDSRTVALIPHLDPGVQRLAKVDLQ